MQSKARSDPTTSEIQSVVRHLVVHKEVREASGPHAIADCPACGKKKKLYVNLDTGAWDCKAGECSEAGGLFHLANILGVRVREKRLVRSSAAVLVNAIGPDKYRQTKAKPKRPSAVVPLAAIEKRAAEIWESPAADVLAYLRDRGLDDVAIRHWRLCTAELRARDGLPTETGIAFPYVDDGKVTMVKMRNLTSNKKLRRYERVRGGESALYGADNIRNRKRVVLVEGEMDAISVWQCGVTAVASTSLGAKPTIPEQWRELLTHAEDIILWYDDDEAGEDAVAGLIDVFGTHRVRIAKIPDDVAEDIEALTGSRPKDANDLVRAGVEPSVIREIIDRAFSVEATTVQRSTAFSDSIMMMLDGASQSLGIRTPWPSLTAKLRGVRPGELTLVTGHTRHGKSTWLTALLDGMAGEDCPVLLSALEDSPESLFRKLFRSRFGRPVSSMREADRDRVVEIIARMDSQPIYIMDHFGRTPMQSVIDAIRYAKRRCGVKAVMVDHIGFFEQTTSRGVDHLDDVLMTLRETARDEAVHVFAIAHPHGRIDELTVPGPGSIKGTSGAKQLCDNGITVYRPASPFGNIQTQADKIKDESGRKIPVDLGKNDVLINVWKARHDEAHEGWMVMKFNGASLTYADTLDDEIEKQEEEEELIFAW